MTSEQAMTTFLREIDEVRTLLADLFRDNPRALLDILKGTRRILATCPEDMDRADRVQVIAAHLGFLEAMRSLGEQARDTP